MIRQIAPDAILTKESGTSGFFEEKTHAAVKYGIPVYVIKRPQLSPFSFLWMVNLVCAARFIGCYQVFLICIAD